MAQVGIYGNFGPGGVVVYAQDDWVTPEMFGTVDGVADEVQINAAIASGRKVKLTFGTIYVIAAPVTITASDSYFDMNGAEIHTVADIDGIHIGAQGVGGSITRLNVKNLYVHKTAGVPTGSGVLVSQVLESNISVVWSEGFYNAVKLEADTSGCHLNKITLGTLIGTKRDLWNAPTFTGWVNANIYYGGLFGGGAIDYCIFNSGGVNRPTGNIFIAPHFEPTSALYAIEEGGVYNVYIEPKTDVVPVWTTDGKPVHFNGNSFYSAVNSHSPQITYTDNGAGSYPVAEWDINTLQIMTALRMTAGVGWNDRLYNLEGNTGTLRGGYGGLFNGDALAYWFIGTDSTNYSLKLDAAGNLETKAGFGCNTKVAQAAYVSGGALSAYSAGAKGFDTDAHAQEIHVLLGKVRTALVANGIMS